MATQENQLSGPTSTLLDSLGFAGSPHWLTAPPNDPIQAQSHRLAQLAGIVGGYYVLTTPQQSANHPSASFPALYVAEAYNARHAKDIRKHIWNLGNSPFLLVVLPDRVRAYGAFAYNQNDEEVGLLHEEEFTDSSAIGSSLSSFHRTKIDSGTIWDLWPDALRTDQRVDQHLLRNLDSLGNELRQGFGLSPQTSHAIIGKFIYIMYLRHRGILSDKWLEEQDIDISRLTSSEEAASELHKLVAALEKRFGGRVFPLSEEEIPSNDVVQFVARVFKGEDAQTGQLSLGFDIYDFSFIPIEMLSAVYEQFLRHANEHLSSGAIYTPEFLADYVLDQVSYVQPLIQGMTVLDPCCGSGVFLVLALRRLIEQKLEEKGGSKLSPGELSGILERSIFGVEQNIDACYVAEFSLLLTLLSYIEPPDLNACKEFRFPVLHNNNIFHGDFFDPLSPISDHRFDWIVGNPPWLELGEKSEQDHLLRWLSANAKKMPVPRRRTGEAFAWRVAGLLCPTGTAGLILHGTTLTNRQLRTFRHEFFSRHKVLRVTNFSNFAYVLFGSRATAPAVSFVFKAEPPLDGHTIIHYGPFVARQTTLRSQRRPRRAFTIVINDSEVVEISGNEAAKGDGLTWKMALWGSPRHTRNISKLRRLLGSTVKDLCKKHDLSLGLGLQLRKPGSEDDALTRLHKLDDLPVLDATSLLKSGRILTVPESALKAPMREVYVRKGRTAGTVLAPGPHVIVAPFVAAYADTDFIVPHPKIAISGSQPDYLKALSLYLGSSVARYLLFFLSVRWGIDRRDLVLSDLKNLPAPTLGVQQVRKLARLHEALSLDEAQGAFGIQQKIDAAVADVLRLPEQQTVMAHEFIAVVLPMDKGRVPKKSISVPTDAALNRYAVRLQHELQEFAGVPHVVRLRAGKELTCCQVWPDERRPLSGCPTITRNQCGLPHELWQKESQWVYLHRSLRQFDGRKVTICKPSTSLDWLESSAIEDSDDVIAEVLSSSNDLN